MTTPETELQPTAPIEELLKVMVKGLRTFQMYLPNNPMYQRGESAVKSSFGPVWELTEELVLVIRETDFVWEDQVVYHQPNKAESLAWSLFKDGMRVLTLKRGVEDGEMIRFLEKVQGARTLSTDAGDDLYTLLWAESFEHISYHFAEMSTEQPLPGAPIGSEMPGGPAGGSDAEVGQRRESVRADAAEEEEAPRRAGVLDMDDFDSTLYWLEEREVRYITDAVEQEYKQDLRLNTLSILLDLLELELGAGVRLEVLGILESLIVHLLNTSEFRPAALILRELRAVLSRTRDLDVDEKARLEGLTGRLSEPAVLNQLLQALDESSTPPPEADLAELFRELRPAALSMLLTWLPRLSNPRLKTLMEQSADQLASQNAREMLTLLRGAAPESLISAIELCKRIKLQPAVPGLSEALTNADPAVRLAAVQALCTIATPGALQHVEKAVEDADRDVRLAAVRELGSRGYKGLLRRIEPLLTSKSSREMDLTERVAVFEAYAAVAGESGLPTLQGLLSAGGLFKSKAPPETRAAAARAIGKIKSAAARELLESFQNDKDLQVRTSVSRSLREGA
ncbi:MAG: HEAT repeat domain-containing protein [Gemmatimonadota bacterium]